MLVITGIFEDERFIPDTPVVIPQNKKVVVTIEEEYSKERTGYAKRIAEIIKNINNSDEVLEGEPGKLNFSASEVAKTL
jgi:hypothetical protein